MGRILDAIRSATQQLPKATPADSLDAAIIAGDEAEIIRHATLLKLDPAAVRAIESAVPLIREATNLPSKQHALIMALPHNAERRKAADAVEIDILHSLDAENRDMGKGKFRAVISGRLATDAENDAIYAEHEAARKRAEAAIVAEAKRRKEALYEAQRWPAMACEGYSGFRQG